MSIDPSQTRASIFSESATILQQSEYQQAQYYMRLQAPQIAAHAQAGQFVHLRCDPSLPLRRPMSIMRMHATQQWIDILFKVHGYGTALLAQQSVGNSIELLGPIGQGFKQQGYKKRPLLIAGGIGIPPLIGLAEHMRDTAPTIKPLVVMGSELPFPFKVRPSNILVPNMPDATIASMALLDDWNIPSRLASQQLFPGCFQGYVTDLAEHWLQQLSVSARQDIEIFACGPSPMLAAVALLANRYNVPCQVSMEAYMACAVGGCAGCTIPIEVNGVRCMQRVCVDGPVFDASQICFAEL